MAQAFFGTAGIFIYWALYIATGFACAYYVYQDSIKQNNRPLKIHPYWWAAITLIGGIFAVLVYWVMHHSTLTKSSNE
jgi:formate hydrogenlyase subunit 3/multisubunit Na+/H+ antiporter MnhD subunit